MPNEQQELTRINWAECFGFTRVFRSFWLAAHPAKLVLALAAVLAMYGVGRVMDRIWGNDVVVNVASTTTVPRNEVSAYLSRSGLAFDHWRDQAIVSRTEAETALLQQALQMDRAGAEQVARAGKAIDEIKAKFDDAKAKAITAVRDRRDATLELLDKQADKQVGKAKDTALAELPTQRQQVDKAHDAMLIQLGKGSLELPSHLDAMVGAVDVLVRQNTLLTDEKDKKLDIESVRADRKTVEDGLRLRRALDQAEAGQGKRVFVTVLREQRKTFGLAVGSVLAGKLWMGEQSDELPGLAGAMKRGLMVFAWFFSVHSWFAVLYLVAWLIVWSVAGGAICRIAALHATRDERISIREALSFSLGKFSSFLTAPLVPVILIVVIGAVLALGGGLAALLSWVGLEFLAAVFWPLALAAGFLVALVTIGAMGGVSLMYPAIATEGSDAFDAMSRSYSYVLTRPWRAAFYGLLAVVYGTVCFLFIKLMAFLTLSLSHFGVGLLMNTKTASKMVTYGKLDAIWAAPSWGESLHGGFWHVPLSMSESISAVLIAIFVFLVIGLIAAYLMTYYYSASTVIYLLLRREVDATELEEVYVEKEPAAEPGDQDDQAATPSPESPLPEESDETA